MPWTMEINWGVNPESSASTSPSPDSTQTWNVLEFIVIAEKYGQVDQVDDSCKDNGDHSRAVDVEESRFR